MIRICFVCLGNICRSPTAEGVMQKLIEQHQLQSSILIDSAGTSSYHVGEPADRRSSAAAARRGFTLTSRSRQFVTSDFAHFDYIIAMDSSNLQRIKQMASSKEQKDKCFLLREFDPQSPKNASVPDPYYGGSNGFEDVLDICIAGCEGLLGHIRSKLP